MLILFCACLAAVVYVYVGYPLFLSMGVFGRKRKQAFPRGSAQPSISVIVAAHNEESSIDAKLTNLLALDYPRDLVEILIGSDGSSDRTEDIVSAFAHEGVGLISFPKQQGKSAMQNGLVAAASGDILVFTDADCLLSRDALSFLVENFADPRVGLVTACPRYLNERETSITENESLYLRYESWLRAQESDRGILAVASGSLFAMRRSLWRPLEPELGDDFVLPLRVAQAGMLNRLDARASAVTHLSQNRPGSMLRMKARIIAKDFRALLLHRALLDPARHGALALGLWSHKLLRWLVPYFLLALAAANAALLGQPLFRVTFALQAAFYALALAGFTWRKGSPASPWLIPMSFCVVNLAALLGTLRCLTGRASGQWTPDRPKATQIPRAVAAPPGGFK
jgi:cellulose synthase/poly-beta-1,6-N-acetylglucosamine synthase-like glycosyltransferase